MDKDYYILLIYKELKDELSDSERGELDNFLRQNPENKTLRDDIHLSWMLSQKAPALDENAIDVERDLKELKSKLHQSNLRIGKGKPPDVSWRRRLLVAASIAIPLIVAGIFLIQNLASESSSTYVATDVIKVIDLKDGSKVWLNKNSSLELDSKFNKEKREVKLRGEAYFQVARDESKTFTVSVDDVEVMVLGTSFGVKENQVSSDHPDYELTVNVVSGKVKVNAGNQSVELEKSEKASYKKSDGELSKQDVLNQNELAWKTGSYVYKNEPLESIVNQLEDLFAVNIEVETTALRQCGISVVVNSNDFQTILKRVADAVNGKVQEEDSTTYQIRDGSCD